MIASFKSKALKRFWWKADGSKLDANHVDKLRVILTALDRATAAADMDLPGFAFHPLTGDQAGRYAVKVDKNWRVTFALDDKDATAVDYEDYH